MIKKKFTEWFHRYKYPELAASSMIIFMALTTNFFQVNKVVEAFMITWAEYLAFYATVMYFRLKEVKKNSPVKKSIFTIKILKQEITGLLIEFGPSAITDALLIRPFFMYSVPLWIGSPILGVILGKFCADFFFYAQTIMSYEWLKRRKAKKKAKLKEFSE